MNQAPTYVRVQAGAPNPIVLKQSKTQNSVSVRLTQASLEKKRKGERAAKISIRRDFSHGYLFFECQILLIFLLMSIEHLIHLRFPEK